MVVGAAVQARVVRSMAVCVFGSLSGGPCAPPSRGACAPPSPRPCVGVSGKCGGTDDGALGSPLWGIPAVGGVSAGKSPEGPEGRDAGSGKDGVGGIGGPDAADIEAAGAEGAGVSAAGTVGGTRADTGSCG